MSYRIAYSDDARQDMKEIVTYLSQFYASTARNFTDKMKKQVSALKDLPYICQAYEDDPYFRRMVIDNYLLFYAVDEEQQLVVVHRLFHSKRDISPQMLDYRTPE